MFNYIHKNLTGEDNTCILHIQIIFIVSNSKLECPNKNPQCLYISPQQKPKAMVHLLLRDSELKQKKGVL
jgi:hypothetical protein